MILFLIRRCLALAALMLGASLLVFALTRGLPGEPMAGMPVDATVGTLLERLRARFGIELPLVAQYLNWLAAALHGDLGRSASATTDVTRVLLQRLPVTLHLVGASLVLALALAVPAAVAAANRKGGVIDRLCGLFFCLGASVPVFWQAIVMILVFAVLLGWLPAGGYVAPDADVVRSTTHMLLPAIVLATGCAAWIQRTLRDALGEALGRDHLVVARAFGQSERRVFWTQVLRPAFAPTLGRAGIAIGNLLAGTVLVETIFNLPGLGRLLVESIRARDYALMQGVALAAVAGVLLFTLAADTLRAFLDRRARVRS